MNKRIIFFFISLIAINISQAEDQQYCGKVWLELPTNQQIQSGKIIEVEQGKDSDPDKIILKDFQGNIVQKFTAPRVIDRLYAINSLENGFIYHSDGKLIFWDLDRNKEVLLTKNHNILTDVKTVSHNSFLTDTAVFTTDKGETGFFNLKTFKKNIIVDDILFTGNKIILSGTRNGLQQTNRVKINNLETGEKQVIELPVSAFVEERSDDSFYVNIHNEDYPNGLYYINTPEGWKQYRPTVRERMQMVLSTGEIVIARDMVTSNGQWQSFLINPANGTEIPIANNLNYGANSGSIAFYPTNGRSRIIPHKDVKEFLIGNNNIGIDLPSGDYSVSNASDGWQVLINSYYSSSRAVYLVNTNTKQLIKLNNLLFDQFSGRDFEIKVSQDKKQVLLKDYYNSFIVNIETGNIRKFQSQGVEFSNNFDKWHINFRNKRKVKETVCLDSKIKILEDDCNCSFRNTNISIEKINNSLAKLNDSILSTMCSSEEFNISSWDKITPVINSGGISKKQALLFLKRFQKKGGFEREKHAEIIQSILKSDMVEQYPYEINEVLKSLNTINPNYFNSIYDIFNLSKRLKFAKDKPKNIICRSDGEKSIVKNTFDEKTKLAKAETPSDTKFWDILKIYRDDINNLPKEEKKAVIEGIADGLSQSASVSPELNGLFRSKIFYFAKKYALDLLGEKFKPATDLSIAFQNGKQIPIILGSGKIEGIDRKKKIIYEDLEDSSYGFDFVTLDPIEIPAKKRKGEKFTRKAEWNHNGKKYLGEAKAEISDSLRAMAPYSNSPNYAHMKKDKKLTGAIIFGASLNEESLQNEYISYYEDEGFEFTEVNASVNTREVLRKKITSGELDYFLKEAHSDGDEKNLLRIMTKSKLYTGIRKRPDGIEEVIYLLGIASNDNNGNSTLVSNHDFGSWLRERGKDSPMIYFNTSCSSARKVIAEISAAKTTNLIAIPSGSIASTFQNTTSSSVRNMLHSFRKEKPYHLIREEMQQSDSYRRKVEDIYVFPDEVEYDRLIRQYLELNIDFFVNVKDPSGNDVHIDENIDH